MDIDLQSVDINQCASGPGWYSNTHLCDPNSTQVRMVGGPFPPLPPPSSQEAHQPLRAPGEILVMR